MAGSPRTAEAGVQVVSRFVAPQMRIVRALILVLCLLLVAIIAVAAVHSESAGSDRARFAAKVASILRNRGAPPQYGRCMVAQLEERLTDKEAKQASGFSLKPAARQKLGESGLTCARRLVSSGNYTAQEVIRMRRRLKPPGF